MTGRGCWRRLRRNTLGLSERQQKQAQRVAKQAKDEQFYKMALRIQARATRRCGELLKEIERPQQGGRPSQKRWGCLPPFRESKLLAKLVCRMTNVSKTCALPRVAGESFRAFAPRTRGGNNTVRITKL